MSAVSAYTEELASEICERIAAPGESIRTDLRVEENARQKAHCSALAQFQSCICHQVRARVGHASR